MIAKVLVEINNINVDKTFDYIVPFEYIEKIKIGMRVKVPFASRELEGFVLDLVNNADDNYELKEIISIVDEKPILNNELLHLGQFMSKKYFSTLISCYQTMLPKALKAQNKTTINKKMIKYVELCSNSFPKLKPNQEKIVEYLRINGKVKKEEVNKISVSGVNTLIKNGIIIESLIEEYRLVTKDINKEKETFKLTVEQQEAKNKILSQTQSSVFLLHGVTGSGKTVVYMEIVEEMLNRGKDSIFLVPEISLTPQMVYHFKSRFGDEVAVLHSRLSEGEKYDEYRKIVEGKVHIVVGARSAVFAPFKNLGAIIIDEEHTTSYKQDNNPKYSAIEIAIERAKNNNAIVILGSATPSLETYARSIKGLYTLVELKHRVNTNNLPLVEIVDMSKEKHRGNIFSSRLITEVNKRLEEHEQIILLLNRRGYSSFITCSNCGYTAKCPHCDITLTYHKTSNTLRCHYCGYADKMNDICPSCGEKAIKTLGTGTEKVEEEIKKVFNARVVRMDLDTTSKKGSHEKIITAFKNHEYDILLGTQMIAKGLDFSNVTLVGVINADTSLMIPNYRSNEYTFQLLMQTAGRSGRGEKKGSVIIQTFNPEHYAITLASKHDYIDFFKQEMEVRRKLSYPPYYYLIYIKVIGKDYNKISIESNKIASILTRELKNSKILGPTTCSVFKLNGLFRFGIIIKYKKEEKMEEVLQSLVNHYKGNQTVKVDIDVNPNNF
ncbi:primosomal protein N' [Clostridium sp. CAG:710]|nr:primosomal protein N' [Clostridium sp. CAG:710]